MDSRGPEVLVGQPTGPHALFLDRLDVATREQVAARATRRRFEAGSIILHEGGSSAGLFVTTRGLVKVFKTSINGRQQTLRYAPPNSSFNEITVIDGGPNPMSAEAVVASEVLVFSRDVILELMAVDPQVSRALIDSLAGLYRHLMQLVEDLSFRQVSERVARVLLQSVLPHPGVGAGVDMHQRPTQSEIAEMIGSTREVVGRALRAFEDAGAIKIERGLIYLVDLTKLPA